MDRSLSFQVGRRLDRRTLLRGAGVAMSLPWLSAMQAAFAAPSEESEPRRFVAMTLGLGLLGDNLYPATAGRDYEASPYLRPLDDLRDSVTLISGASHPGVTGGHRAEACILSANPTGSSGRNSVSLDQHLARLLGNQTRFPSLVLSSSGSNSPSYTENGAMIPAEDSPSRLFQRLFVDDSPKERAAQALSVREGRSIMDLVGEDARRLNRQLGAGDRQRMDAYYASVRDLEKRLAASEAWRNAPSRKSRRRARSTLAIPMTSSDANV